MAEKIRYGVIGCGSIGRERIENIKALRGTTVTAIADPHPASRAQTRALLERAAGVRASPRSPRQRIVRRAGDRHAEFHSCRGPARRARHGPVDPGGDAAVGTPAEVTLEEGLRGVATRLAAHRSVDTDRAVALAEVLPAGW